MMISRSFRTIGPALLLLAAATADVAAQNPPPGAMPGQPAPGQNPVCARLEAQLASIDRGDPTRADQIRRYEEALQAQQGELDRTVALGSRNGCERSGFFLFGRNNSPQCDDINNRIQKMRQNVDRLTNELQQMRGGISVEGQRRQVLMALGQYNCGPQYRSAEAPPAQPSGPRGFLQSLFGGGGGGGGGNNAPSLFGSGDVTPSDQSSSYRTICVRTCDGYFFPVSYSTSQARFRDDEQACQRMCPASEVQLFTYRNPGEDVAQAVSVSGQPYSSLPNAFRYRQEFNAACSCRRPGESWADALKHLDDTTVERGDIVVTEETAKAMSQPKPDAPQRAAKQAPKGKNEPRSLAPPGTPAPVSAAPIPDATPAAPEPAPAPAAAAPAAPAEGGKKQIRTVGPPFIVR
jgi:hypothetical protein